MPVSISPAQHRVVRFVCEYRLRTLKAKSPGRRSPRVQNAKRDMWRRVPHSSQKGSNTTPQSTGQASRSPGKPSLQLPGVEQQWPAADESVISVRRDYAAGTTRTPLEAVRRGCTHTHTRPRPPGHLRDERSARRRESDMRGGGDARRRSGWSTPARARSPRTRRGLRPRGRSAAWLEPPPRCVLPFPSSLPRRAALARAAPSPGTAAVSVCVWLWTEARGMNRRSSLHPSSFRW